MTDERPKGKRRKWIWIGLGVLIVIGIASAGSGDDEDKASETTLASTTTVAGATSTTVAATTTAPATWQVVTELSGSSEKTGDTFHLDKAQTRLTYSSNEGVFYAYVMKDGDTLESDGGIPEVSCSEKCDDTTNLRRDPGDYYLAVRGSGTWTVKVEQYLS